MGRILETWSDWSSVGMDIKIEEMRDYLDTLNKQLDQMPKDYEKRIEAGAEGIEDEDERDEYYEWHSDFYWRYKETFPRIFLNSYHISAYSLLESEIYSVARRVGEKKHEVFDVSDIKGRDYLESASSYIKKLTLIDAATFSSWSSLKEGQRLRNIIVHSNGKVTKQDNIEVAKKHKVYNESNEELSITYDYCKAFLDTLRTFFTELYRHTKAGDFL